MRIGISCACIRIGRGGCGCAHCCDASEWVIAYIYIRIKLLTANTINKIPISTVIHP